MTPIVRLRVPEGAPRAARARGAAAPGTLSPGDRAILVALARAAIPPGRIFPGAGEATLSRVETFVASLPAAARAALIAAARAIDASARVTRGRRLSALDAAGCLAVMDAWHRGSYPRRMTLRLLLMPIKVAHFEDPALHRAVGCVWGVDPPAAAETPRAVPERVVAGAAIEGDEVVDADVVVIGTGAGGAAAACELAERNLAVVMLEEGRWHTRADFTGRAVEMQRRLYRDMGVTGSVGNVFIPIPLGRGVGGTTTVNSGTCYRAPDRVLARWRGELGLRELSPEELAPYYRRVERVLGVAPADARYLGGVARVIARGCDALGWTRHGPLARNAPDCDGRGVCVFGCPTDAKRSTNVSYVPLALRAGAVLYTGARAGRVLREGGRAAGVLARTSGGGTLRVRARAVVAACGTLLTPLLLRRSGLRSRAIGRHLSIHPAVGAMAVFDERIDGANAIPQGYAIEQFHDEGLLYEGAFVPLDIAAGSLPMYGPRFMELIEAYDRTAMFGFMIEDRSSGRVRPGPGGRPLVTYRVADRDVARLRRGLDLLAQVYLAAGARTVLPMVHGIDEIRDHADLRRFRRTPLSPRDFDLTAYHPLGTARIAADPALGACRPDHETWELPGLYVLDGAAVPTSLAVNPQLTIMALATRAARLLAERLG